MSASATRPTWLPREQWLKTRKSLAVTAVDTWRKFKLRDEELTTEDFRKELLDRATSPAMQVGNAAHAILEHAQPGDVIDGTPGGQVASFAELMDEVERKQRGSDRSFPTRFGRTRIQDFGDNYYTVTMDEQHGPVRVDLHFEIGDDVDLALPPVREMVLGAEYQTRVGPVWVTGRTDGFDRIQVNDHKFTGSPDMEALAESMQWRIYLDIAKADRFRWDVFTMREPLKNETAWRIVAHQHLVQFAYPGMHDDVARMVDETAAAIDTYAPEYWRRYER